MDDIPSATDRRAQVTAAIMAETGIDHAMIHRVVHTFYDRVRADALLGPVFGARITDWEPHLANMCRFWSSVTLKTGIYSGSPMQRHAPLPVDAAHFDRWLELFTQTVTEVCPPAAAAVFLDAAHRIAQSLEFGIASHRDLMLGKGQRLPAV
ncbi:MAG: group III truncated hemoglobin [Hyphomicrobiaceae bacterium]